MANMVRGIDELGRVVIPSEIRKQLGWVQGTRLEIIPADAAVLVRAQDFGSAADTPGGCRRWWGTRTRTWRSCCPRWWPDWR